MNTETMFFIEIIALFTIQGFVSAYVFCDARQREMNPYLWTIFSFIAPILIGLVVYLFVRKENEKTWWKGILAIVVSLALLVGTIIIPRSIKSTFATFEEGEGAVSGELIEQASVESLYVESYEPRQYAQCAVYTWGGAVIDESSYLWLWDEATMIAEKTSVGNIKAVAQSADWPSRVYFLTNDGTVGYIVAGEIGITDSFIGANEPVFLESPKAIVHIVANGEGCYAVDSSGCVFYYNRDDELFLIEDRIAFADLQYVNGGLFGRGADGNYYALGNDVFGIHTPNSEASADISSPEQLFDGTNLEDVHVFGVTGSSNAMFAELYAGQNLHVYNNAGAEVCSLSGCMALYSGYDALYAIDINGNLYAYGEHSSGAPLYDGTSVYEETPSPWLLAEGLGSNVRSIGIGGWDVALVLEDGSVRTWGQVDGDGYSDCYVTDETGNKYFLDSYEPTIMAEETNSEFCEHIFIVEETIAATDTEYGLLTYKCNMCGLNYTVQTLPIS